MVVTSLTKIFPLIVCGFECQHLVETSMVMHKSKCRKCMYTCKCSISMIVKRGCISLNVWWKGVIPLDAFVFKFPHVIMP